MFGALRGDQHNNMTADMLEVTEPQKGMPYHGYRIVFNTEKNNNGGRKTKGENHQAHITYIPPGPSSGPNVTAVANLDLYLSMRPDGCSPKLYFQSDRKGKFAYTKQPIGKNMIAKFLQDGCNSVGIDYERITNQSLRKTNATRLYAAGVEEQLIMESTGKLSKLFTAFVLDIILLLILFVKIFIGHHSIEAVCKYKLPTTEERVETAVLLSGMNQASSSTHTGLVHSTQSLKRTRTEENHLVYHDSNVQQQKKRVVTRPVVDSRVASESTININPSAASSERIGEILSSIL